VASPRGKSQNGKAPLNGKGVPGHERWAEEQVQGSKELFHSIFDNAGTGMSVVAPDGRFLLVNRCLCGILGYSQQELLAMTFTDVTHPDDVDSNWQYMRQVEAGEIDSFHLEKRYVHKLGHAVWALVNVSAVRDAGGKLLYVTSQLQDITERKRAEEALKQSEERYRAFVAGSSEGIMRIEFEQPIPVDLPEDKQIDLLYKHGYLAECNDEMARRQGFSRAEELVGARLGDILARQDPRNIEHLRAFIRSDYRLTDADLTEVDAQGNRLYFSNNLTGVVESGSLTRAWSTRRDITERKEAEEALREGEALLQSILDNAPGVIFIKDRQGRYILLNKAFEETLHVTRADALGKTDYDLFPKETAEVLLGNDRQVFDAGTAMAFEETVPEDDGPLTSITVKFPLFDADGIVYAICGIATDITERKAYEQKLREHATEQAQLLNQLTNAQEAERRRLSMDIHDGPLQSLGVALMALDRAMRRQERGEDEKARQELSFLRSNLATTVGEVRQVLADLSNDVLTNYGLAVALEGQVERFSDVTGIEVELNHALGTFVPPDMELLMYRLAQEAMANIRKHSHAQSARILLRTVDNILHLTISDDGRGFNVAEVLANYEDGKRLGLRSMRERVQAVGGDLHIVSEPNKGTTLEFWCSLPERGTKPLALAGI
jgi:PAS domain S-box-containing protein